MAGQQSIVLNGSDLTAADVTKVARSAAITIAIDETAMKRVENCHTVVRQRVQEYLTEFANRETNSAHPIPEAMEYGVTTGFGSFKKEAIAAADLLLLQQNIILSHAVGTGINSDADDMANYYPFDVVRAALVIRINAFLRGNSGVRRELVETLVRMVNEGIVPLVPLHGSVGASGDLCPLCHLSAPLLDHGRFYQVKDGDEGKRPTQIFAGNELKGFGIVLPAPSDDLTMRLDYKEGLALSNGTTFSAAILALAICDSERLLNTADAAAALAMESIGACARALEPEVHKSRGHAGQMLSAANIRSLLDRSQWIDSNAREVQDAYSMRCAPAVHGASYDTLAFVKRTVETELNASTDNPLFFPPELFPNMQPWDRKFQANWPKDERGNPLYDGEKRIGYSAGNFHGQPLALAADFLAIAMAEIASISERRSQMMLDHHHNRGLPANLTANPGVNSGLMIAQYCAAGIVSENKVLAHPASVDSIPTSANAEDHVSMSTVAARKLQVVLRNVEGVLALELLISAQAVEWRAVVSTIREKLSDLRPPERARLLGERFVREWEKSGSKLGVGTKKVYQLVRGAVATLRSDRFLADDVLSVRKLVASGSIGEVLANPFKTFHS